MHQDPDSSVPSPPATLPGSWDGLVVLQAARPWDGVQFADQRLAEALSRFVPVLYVDPPVPVLSALRQPGERPSLSRPWLRLIAPGLARLTPLAPPGGGRPRMLPVTARLTSRAMASATRVLGGRVRALVAGSAPLPEPGCCGEELTVLWARHPLTGAGERARREEEEWAARADLIVAADHAALDTWRKRGRAPLLIPFGFDATLLRRTDTASVPLDVDLPEPVAGYVGHLGERLDLSLLEAAAATGCSLLLVGSRHPSLANGEMTRLLARPNVRWAGPKPHAEIARYLRVIQVGLVPYDDNPFTRGTFPVSSLEYLAAGCGVVATDLPAIRWLGTPLIDVVAGPAAFAAAVAKALRVPRTPELVRRRRAFAATHTWDRRAESLAAALGIPVRPYPWSPSRRQRPVNGVIHRPT